ncbi:MAG: M1 family metallopeptidase [Bacteroidota bacterium]
MHRLLSLFSLMLLLAMACNTTKPVVTAPEMEVRELDTLVITPDPIIEASEEESYSLPVYRAAYHRTHDLLHTSLRLSFDWAQEQVIGQANLRLTPLAKASDRLRLDAKGFDFKSIRLTNNQKELEYEYSGEQQEVFINLDRIYQPGEEFELFIDYVATPKASGGSQAITSDKGLFFINPRNEEPNKPQQIWTQGETEHNSRWFPTIDKPNERCTQEMYLTVDNKYQTLSNGLLVESKENGDGTRTDYWKMDLPHAPYLFMIAVGEFSVVDDAPWNGVPVNYYVEEEYENYAKDIFPYTPEMLTFFSEVTGVKYPWSKYSQVVVRDYVSGAMENTTGVIFGEFMYGTDRELMDADINEKIVAHEMFHHWFGDYVTCESWSNLTLNEGFANYSEYLWLEHKHGRDKADDHLLDEWAGYIGSIQQGGEPHELIWTDYDDKEQMFDAHSYNKGGAVLHMLRYYLGDDVFFASFENYLTKNQYSPVEVDELRMAFEEESGQDLHWFFNQWFHKAGHPRLEVSTGYDVETREAYVDVKQIQTTLYNVPAIFQLPVSVDVYSGGSPVPSRHEVMINQREQRLSFPVKSKPDLIVFDAEHALLAEIEEEKTVGELLHQFKHGKRLLDRVGPINQLADRDPAQLSSIISTALNDPFSGVRLAALENMDTPDKTTTTILYRLADSDPNSEVRAAALMTLASIEDPKATELAKGALQAKSYTVVGAGLEALTKLDPALASKEAAKLEDTDNADLISAIGNLYVENGAVEKLAFFEKKLSKIDGYESFDFYGNYLKLLLQAEETDQLRGLDQLVSVAKGKGQSPWRRIAAFQCVAGALTGIQQTAAAESDLAKKVPHLKEALQEIKDNEPAGQIKQILEQIFPG